MNSNQPNPNITPRYCNIATFARLPIWNDEDIDIGIMGIPFDGGCCYRTGARFGPNGIRENSRLLRSYNPEQDVYPFSKNVYDIGDISVTPFDNKKAVEQIYTKLKSLNNIPNIIFMGGDHTISYPILKYLSEKHNQPITLIHFDSHQDTWEEYFGENVTHGTPFKRCFEENLINPDTSIHIGVRGSINDINDYKNDAEMGFKTIFCSEIDEIGVNGIIEKIKKRVKDSLCYISIDIDVLDPAFAPGTGTPEPGGFSTRELLSILRGIKDLNIVSGDVVETAPCYDNQSNITSLNSAKLIYELVCMIK